MRDLIDRQQAIDAIVKARDRQAEKQEYGWEWEYNGFNHAIQALPMPSEQPKKTCCGYDVKELIAFAIACRRAGVDEKDLKCFAQNCESAWKVMQEEFNNAIKETLEKW